MDYGNRGPRQFEISSYSALVALRHESDPELRAEGMLRLAGREARLRPEVAAELYSTLLEDGAIPTSLRERAQSRLAALQGEGALSAQAETLFNRFTREATEPSTLLALTAAGLAYRASRFVMLGRLAMSPQVSLLTRGFGARVLAGLAGFGVEATVFPLAGRAGNFVLGREQAWSGSALSRELASSFVMLGALRAGGLAVGSLASPTLRPWLQPLGMYGGLLLGHELEVRGGLREAESLTQTLMGSLATLLQFHVAGRLSRSLMGGGLRSWERGVEVRSSVLERNLLNPPLPPLFQRGGWQQVGSIPPFGKGGLGGIFPRPAWAAEGPLADRILMMQGGDGEGPRDRSESSAPPSRGRVISLAEYRRRLEERAQDELEEEPTQRGRPETPRRSEPVPKVLPFPRAPEIWRDQVQEALMYWLAAHPVNPRREYQAIEQILQEEPAPFRNLIGYLCEQHPLAARLLMIRKGILAENSLLRLDPLVREAHRQQASDFYSREAMDAMYEVVWLRYVHNLRFDERTFSLHDVPMSSPEFHQRFYSTHPAYLAVVSQNSLPADMFMPFMRELEIFPYPEGTE